MRTPLKRILSAALCAFLIDALVPPYPGAAFAADDGVEVYSLVESKKLEDGSWTREYWVDSHGNRVEKPTVRMSKSARKRAAASLPRSYDLRTRGIVTSVKNQAGADSCWAFGSIGALESNYILRGYGSTSGTNFSEAHAVWFSQRQRTTNTSDPTYGDGRQIENPFTIGSNWYNLASTLMRGAGLVNERDAPWIESDDADTLMQMAQPESDRYISDARAWSMTGIPGNSAELFKQKLMENGSGIFSYYEDFVSYGLDGKSYYQSIETNANHVVQVIGWDDDYAVSSFKSGKQPSSPGAWLVKGSWGKSYADKGYYWISYEDTSLQRFSTFVTAPWDTYDYIYQYDGAYTSIAFVLSDKGTIANLFTAKRTEWLTHAAFYSPNETPVNATVEIYLAQDGYQLSGVDPTKGMYRVDTATTTVSNVCEGYTTVELANEVLLRPGQKYTVAVTLERSGSEVWIPVEGTPTDDPDGLTTTYGGKPGTSFACLNSKWYDTTDHNGNNYHNVPVKAMTRDVEMYGHTFGNPKWNWSHDYSWAGAEFVCADCGYVMSFSSESVQIQSDRISVPTCTSGAVMKYTATLKAFGGKFISTVGPVTVGQPLGHNYKPDVTPPDCVLCGYTIYSCTRCSSVYLDDITDPLGHDLSIVVNTVDPTCTSDGYTVYQCSRCEETIRADDRPALGHNFAQGVVTREPTCITDGTMTYTCTRCSVTHTDAIRMLGHDLDSEEVRATCTTGGYFASICKRCGARMILGETEPLGHNYNAVVTAATCTTDGYTTYTCSRCGNKYIDDIINPLGHDYKGVVTPATCTVGGYMTYTCKRCGVSYTADETEPLGHDYKGVVTPATCTAGGYTTYTCSRCGDKYTADETEPLGHDYSVVSRVVEPGCYSRGYTVYKCSRCTKTENRDYTDPAGHDFSVVEQTVEATCTEGGYTVYKCVRCSMTEGGDYTEPLGHDHSIVLEVVEATCDAGGYTVYRCSRCGKSVIADEVDAFGHDCGEGVVTVEPECDAEGVRLYTCSRCGMTRKVRLDALGHDYDVIVTPATCTYGGWSEYTCKRCGISFVADEIDALGHDFDEWTWKKPLSVGGINTQTRTCARCGEQETRKNILPADTLILEVDDVRAVNRAGKTVRVPVRAFRNPGAESVKLSLEYDQTKLTLRNVENGDMIPDGITASDGDLSAMPYEVIWNDAAPADHAGTGVLITFVFEVLSGAENGELPIRLHAEASDTLNGEWHTVPACTVPGSVKLADRVAGDTNNDGAVSLADVAVLSRYLAGGWNVTIEESGADVNGDGVFNMRDVVLIRRYLAGGWNVTLI